MADSQKGTWFVVQEPSEPALPPMRLVSFRLPVVINMVDAPVERC